MRLLLVLCLFCSGCGVVEAISHLFSGDRPCDEDNGGCGAHATCQMPEETPICACLPDYEGDGKSCRPSPAEPTAALISSIDFTCALASEGSLLCWGILATPDVPDGPNSPLHPTATRVGEERAWLRFSASGYFLCGILRTGALSCQEGFEGAPFSLGQPDSHASDEGRTFVSVSAGPYNTCAINAAGELWCWQHFHASDNGPPFQIPSLAPWSSVVSGPDDVCAIRNDNTLWCWHAGSPYDYSPPTDPIEIDPSRHWTRLSTGDGPLYGIDERGALFSLGHDLTSGEPRVQQVSDAVGWTRVASGRAHLCALKQDGTVWCRGLSSRGEAGGELSNEWRDTLVQVKSSQRFESVSVGDSHSCAATASGDVWCWGDNRLGQLGNDLGAALPALRQVPLTLPAVQVSAGEDASCAIDSAHALWCWGRNRSGGVGDGTYTVRPTPVRTGTAQWRLVSASAGSAGVQENGSLWFWGASEETPVEAGQTYDWSTASNSVWDVSGLDSDGELWLALDSANPVQLEGRWRQFAEAHSHLCAIREDDSLWCEGSNDQGQLGVGTTEDADDLQPVSAPATWSAVAVGEHRTCGIQTDGTLLCWGRALLDPSTSLLVPTAVPGTEAFHWQAVSIGAAHACALREDATIWCWGSNASGQLGTHDSPSGFIPPVQVGQGSDWAAVSAATAHTCGLRRDGSAWCWGTNGRDELGDGANARSQPVQVMMPGQ